MSFPAFLRTRWAALQSVWARLLQRPEKLLSLHSLLWALMAAGLALLRNADGVQAISVGEISVRLQR